MWSHKGWRKLRFNVPRELEIFLEKKDGQTSETQLQQITTVLFFSTEWVVSWHVMLWLNISQIPYLLFITENFLM